MKRAPIWAMCALPICALPMCAQAHAQDAGQPLSVEMAEAMVDAAEDAALDAAQDQPDDTAVGSEQDEASDTGPGGMDRSGPSAILLAPARFLAAYGEDWLDADREICLEEGEVVTLAPADTRVTSVELRGPLCTRAADAAEVATVLVEATAPASRPRTGAVRGVLSRVVRSTAPEFRVAAGSEGVLARYPRGMRVGQSAQICLERGEQVTLISSAGQRVTYRGPGCARRNANPGGRNVGGFTFGWNGHPRAHASPVGSIVLP